MAGVGFRASTAAVATGTSEKTILQVAAATNHRAIIHEWSLSFDGTSNTGTPVTVQLMRQTDAGTMTSLTLVKENTGDAETLQTTAQHTATVEPTSGDVLETHYIHPQGGGYTWQAPHMHDIPVVGGTRLAIVVTAGANVNVRANIKGSE